MRIRRERASRATAKRRSALLLRSTIDIYRKTKRSDPLIVFNAFGFGYLQALGAAWAVGEVATLMAHVCVFAVIAAVFLRATHTTQLQVARFAQGGVIVLAGLWYATVAADPCESVMRHRSRLQDRDGTAAPHEWFLRVGRALAAPLAGEFYAAFPLATVAVSIACAGHGRSCGRLGLRRSMHRLDRPQLGGGVTHAALVLPDDVDSAGRDGACVSDAISADESGAALRLATLGLAERGPLRICTGFSVRGIVIGPLRPALANGLPTASLCVSVHNDRGAAAACSELCDAARSPAMCRHALVAPRHPMLQRTDAGVPALLP